jgi:mannose-6-phosphate isomerase
MSCRKITNETKDYAWGSTNLIPEFLEVEPNGKPQAEIWFGTHPSSTAYFVDTEQGIDEEVDLPFMVKILAADKPLSIQVHPNKQQAEIGFIKENISNIHRNAFNRNYKDDNHKPEMIIAVNDNFRALCGFQDVSKSVKALDEIIKHAEYSSDINNLNNFKDKLADSKNEIKDIMHQLLTSSNGYEIAISLTNALKRIHIDKTTDEHIKTLKKASEHFNNDVGLAVALMMNTVILKKGESLYLPAGNIHAYIEGIGVEVMANSDNVLRGGLTTKYLDPEELLKVVDTEVMENPICQPVEDNNTRTWKLIEDFTIVEVTDAKLELEDSFYVVIALEKSKINFNGEPVSFDRGEAALVQGESSCTVEGKVLFVR